MWHDSEFKLMHCLKATFFDLEKDLQASTAQLFFIKALSVKNRQHTMAKK